MSLFILVTESYPTLCDPMDRSMWGLLCLSPSPGACPNACPLSHDAIQPSHPLLSPSPAFNLSQYQGLFQWVSS